MPCLMKKLTLFAIMITLLIPAMGGFAQDSGNNVPEIGSPQDNECFEGGDWAGSCSTMWHWVCGWYLARYTDGIFEYGEIPTWCSIPAPTIPESITNAGTGTDVCTQTYGASWAVGSTCQSQHLTNFDYYVYQFSINNGTCCTRCIFLYLSHTPIVGMPTCP